MGNATNLIVALDNLESEAALWASQRLKDASWDNSWRVVIKVNDLLGDIGLQWVGDLFENMPFRLMIDGKWHDIGETVTNYLRKLAKNEKLKDKVEYITVHASNGRVGLSKLMAEKKKLGLDNLKILAISALTSLNDQDTNRIFDETAKHAVLKLAKEAIEAGIDGLVCSPLEAEAVRAVYGDTLILVTPWVRFDDAKVSWDDQERVNNPERTIRSGSTDIVMGRPILQAPSMSEAVERFFNEVQWVIPEIDLRKYAFEKLLYTGDWESLLKYIGAFYVRPESGTYCRLTSGLLSNGYINIWASERNYLVLERAANDLTDSILKLSSWEKDAKGEDIPLISPKAEKRKDIVVMGAAMWSVRLSAYLWEKLWIEESIYAEKSNPFKEAVDSILKDDSELTSWQLKDRLRGIPKERILLWRHDIDLKGKKVILSEDITTEWTTIEQMCAIVEEKGGEVIAITCVGNRYWKDFFEYNWKRIPLVSCFTPAAFELFYDEKTPEKARKNRPMLPVWASVSNKPKDDWTELVMSMRK